MKRESRTTWLLVIGLLLLLAGALGYFVGAQRALAVFPQDGSAEVGFARDMATHHAQAVEMALIVRDNSDDPMIRLLALDMLLTQQAQKGIMYGWLGIWGVTNGTTDPAMAWMGMPTTGPMPGMASPEDLNLLRERKGVEADGQFLRLMIPHHRAGVVMAQAALDRTTQPDVRALAQSIVNAQQSEIDYMQKLLQDKGLPPVPDDPGMNHETMTK